MHDLAIGKTDRSLLTAENSDLSGFSPAELEDLQALTMALLAEYAEHMREITRRNQRMQVLLDKIKEHAQRLEAQQELEETEYRQQIPQSGLASVGRSLGEIIETERSGRLSDFDWYTAEGQRIPELHVQCPVRVPAQGASPTEWTAHMVRWARRSGLAYFTVARIEQRQNRLVGSLELPLERYDLSILTKLADRSRLVIFGDIRVHVPRFPGSQGRPWRFSYNLLGELWGVKRRA